MNNYEVMYIVKPVVEEEAFEADVLVTFSAEPKAVKELDRVMKITDEVMRHMVIKKGE